MQERASPQASVHDTPANPSDFLNLHEIVAKARQNLNQNDWDYIVGGTESETTLRRNRMALDHDRVPAAGAARRQQGRCVGRTSSAASCGCRWCWRRSARWKAFTPRAPPRWCAASGSSAPRHMLSSVCDPGLEELAAAAPDALRIFQLYVRGDEAWVDDHVERAIAHGYAAFCLTVDTAHYSRRERDIAKRFVTAGRRRVQGRAYQAALDWRTVKRIKQKFKIPLIIKGIATAEDTSIALDHGVEWIYVSNHGGRQLDHGRGSMDVLPEVVEAAAGRAKVMVDGSICRGTDIVKAIAIGGRPGRHRPHAVLRARGRRPGRRGAAARAAGGRGAALPRPPRRHRASPSSTAPTCTPRRRPTRRTC